MPPFWEFPHFKAKRLKAGAPAVAESKRRRAPKVHPRRKSALADARGPAVFTMEMPACAAILDI
jgi:hypothetical protein